MDNDIISRQAAIDVLEAKKDKSAKGDIGCFYNTIIQNNIDALKGLPSAQQEPLTDVEKRIFLSAMERELEVCKEIDNETVREAYVVSLVKVCKEIKRKVMGSLWT